ncbi:hypothetical protein FRC08_001271 [Ceratobasidium sp. 394]|nr:hypothetical protein FRC08_001271 [Ceratobasidium sp. 394]
MTSSPPKASSTFWLIDTTSVSDTFTTTATLTLWVPLYTTSTTPTPSATATPIGQTTSPRSKTGLIAGSVVGCVVLAALAVLSYSIFRIRRARPQFTLHQADALKASDANQPDSSMHALVDLAAEPDPHPSNIEPWVAPTAVRRTDKIRPRADLTERDEETRVQELAEPPPPIIEPPRVVEPIHHELSPIRSTTGRALQLVQHDDVASTLTTRISHNSKSERPAPQPRRRRNQRDTSPPRLEEDAGVSLMRAGDNVLTPADEPLPPAYNFASGSTL